MEQQAQLQRLDYTRYQKSIWNEPIDTIDGYSQYLNYPDMFSVYNAFSNHFNIPTNMFILGNGCENILKNVLLGLSASHLVIAQPTWGMVFVICQALGIKCSTYTYQYDDVDKTFVEPTIDPEYSTDGTVYYDCNGRNNYFSYNRNPNNRSVFTIRDISYSTLKQIKQEIADFRDNNIDNQVIIGSFDKVIGCGLRCGFAIFPPAFNHAIQLQREQFINKPSCDFIVNDLSRAVDSDISYLDGYQFFDHCRNYITVRGNYNGPVAHKNFCVNDVGRPINFTRFGLTKDRATLQLIERIHLKNAGL